MSYQIGFGSNNKIEKRFLDMMNDLALVWPQINTKARLSRYMKALGSLPIEAYDDIYNTLVDNFKTAPVPNDFSEAAKAWHRSHNYQKEKEEFEPAMVHCLKCYDSGFNFIKLNEKEPRVLVFCDCYFGEQNCNIYDSMMPRWNTSFIQMGFIRLPFDVAPFIPKAQGEITLGKMQSTIERFRKKLYESRDYFIELPKRQSRGEISI
jgi:hypothetical protein